MDGNYKAWHYGFAPLVGGDIDSVAVLEFSGTLYQHEAKHAI